MRPMDEVLEEAGLYFMKRSPVHLAARRIAAALEEMGIPFAIAGALAINAHGHVRMTEDVDVLLTEEGLQAFKARWLGRGWVERFPGSRGLRDTQHNVKVDVILTGHYPGDGKPKPIAFPDPKDAAEPGPDGYLVLPFKTALELKIASGMTAPHRPRDFDDAIQLIFKNRLSPEYAERLDPYVRAKYGELWALAQQVDEDY